MEVENRDVLRSFLKASERQDEEEMREYLHPEIRVIEAESLPYGGIHAVSFTHLTLPTICSV